MCLRVENSSATSVSGLQAAVLRVERRGIGVLVVVVVVASTRRRRDGQSRGNNGQSGMLFRRAGLVLVVGLRVSAHDTTRHDTNDAGSFPWWPAAAKQHRRIHLSHSRASYTYFRASHCCALRLTCLCPPPDRVSHPEQLFTRRMSIARMPERRESPLGRASVCDASSVYFRLSPPPPLAVPSIHMHAHARAASPSANRAARQGPTATRCSPCRRSLASNGYLEEARARA